MDVFSVDNMNAAQLARLLDVDHVHSWGAADAAAALRHQLAAQLLPELVVVPGIDGTLVRRLLANPATPATFLGQLTAPQPALELLESIKLFARHVRDLQGSPMTGGPATVLYYAAIAAALVHGGSRKTSLSDKELENGFAWALDQLGAEALKSLFSKALAQFAET